MARRSELSGDERVADIQRKAAARQRNKRSRDRHVTLISSHVTDVPRNGAAHVTPSRTLPVRGAITEGGLRGVEAILAPFEQRGYKHQPVFWAKMAAKYPALDLELEALKLADWLEWPKNAKALCSRARIDNWLGIAEERRLRPQSNGTTNGTYHAPATRQRTPDPEGLPVFPAGLERVPPAPRRAGTLKEKLAAIRGGKR